MKNRARISRTAKPRVARPPAVRGQGVRVSNLARLSSMTTNTPPSATRPLSQRRTGPRPTTR